ncbi:hypothetical protein [Lysobacter enzymogenes]|uniref:Uncharacterized protein n=1 Tax=Lysobacter enzymogenes TaxID=69 RepID=A0A0S2DGC9_LYSEN|nr:hypothetical protein [Lysobacter enzymogenes]ALN57671.1 hypothetical protein GLE_2322 [Lysobacter enzymogenes]QCW26227.1 hypothetical protein FE772_11650 [Lysobacter enzymogenes]QQP99192.1 hypothetical protein JHW41_13740 [Lysobacter enzymogenes]
MSLRPFPPRSFRRALAALTLLLAAGGAQAACPDGSPCETIAVYRVQTWPALLTDAAGRDSLSLQEANGTSQASFEPVIKGYAGGPKTLAIRFSVIRIASAPNAYCNCNFELGDKACKTSDLDLLKQCKRVCLNSGKTCTATGKDDKSDGGAWYAFPASTRCVTRDAAPTQQWKKNAFEVNPKNCDWYQASSSIKRAACVADALKLDPSLDLDRLFANEAPCATVDAATLQQEAIPR